jgi:hypothetical protein
VRVWRIRRSTREGATGIDRLLIMTMVNIDQSH